MKIINFFKKYPLSILVIVLLIPLVISSFMYIPWFSYSKGNVDGWLGFWGSFLGGIIGAFGVIITTYFIIEANKQTTKDAANLQDKQNREREYITYLLHKNEDLYQAMLKMNQQIQIIEKNVEKYQRIKFEINKVTSDVFIEQLIRSTIGDTKGLSEGEKNKNNLEIILNSLQIEIENNIQIARNNLAVVESKVVYFVNLTSKFSELQLKTSIYISNIFENNQNDNNELLQNNYRDSFQELENAIRDQSQQLLKKLSGAY